MDLIDVDRAVIKRAIRLFLQPFAVPPLIAVQVIYLGGVRGPGLKVKGVRIGFHHPFAAGCLDIILVHIVFADILGHTFPYTAVAHTGHRQGIRIPGVEFPHQGNPPRMRCPHAEYIAFVPSVMASHPLISPGIPSQMGRFGFPSPKNSLFHIALPFRERQKFPAFILPISIEKFKRICEYSENIAKPICKYL